ncbi:TetR/AcrR family transcriptional regulator [Paenibacillus graminis]|uniref:TetR/AcrR family transcriptional regulator n=1 Tax=Paenibacillus graminis TaxID=189425 RepID=UPI002DBB8429|nr:TetR/AcrR family transcriptional regulator [Paenibacillus graminis]MEC0168059.1 TetR/AcrR family transcriptional regulator [Paenibacillus graminis]
MNTEMKLDRRVARTREAISKAFLELFSEKKFSQITIHDISERANVNRGTFYLHYTDKYDLLDQCIEEHLKQLLTFCSHNKSREGITTLASELKPVFEFLETNFLFFSAMLQNQRTEVFRERLLEFVSANIKEELDSQKADTLIIHELNAQFMASAFVGIVEYWIRNNMPHPPQYMAEQMWRLFERNEISPG